MAEFPFLNIGHQKQESKDYIKVELINGGSQKGIESSYLHRHSFYTLILFLEGTGQHIVDFDKIRIKPNRLFFLNPNQVHLLKVNEAVKYDIIQFSENYVLFYNSSISIHQDFKFISPLNAQIFVDLENSKTYELHQLFRQIKKERESPLSNDKVVANYLQIVLEKIKIYLEPSQNLNNDINPIIQSYFNLIECHFNESLSVKHYSDKLNISSNYLNILSNRETGKSALSHVNDRLILEAKRLVVHSDLSISQIAHKLNYCDTSYFIKKFKASTGVSPKEFKRQFYNSLYD